MGCLSGIIKYLVFIFNFIIAICGIILITFGAIAIVKDGGVEGVTSFSVGGFAVAVGVFIFIIAFFGCCGAIKENSCMLTTYAVILIILFILQVVLGALAFVAVRDGNGQFTDEVEEAVKKIFDDYTKNKETVDTIQQELECCGVKSANYWPTLPLSCCPNSTLTGGSAAECTLSKAFSENCTDAVADLLSSNIKIIGGIALGFAIVELLGAIFACIIKHRH